MEQEVIGDIARRVKKTGRYTETAELMAKSMMESGYSPAKIRAEVMRKMRTDKALQDEIAKNTKEYKQFVTGEIKATVKAAKEAGDNLISEAGMMAYNNDLSMWSKAGQDLTKPNNLTQIMAAYKAQTLGELRNLTRSTGFKGLAFEAVKNAYQLEMDRALVKVASGAYSYDQAVNDCVKSLAQSGLRSIDYASGRSYQLDTAARMSVRTGLSQLSGKITEANIESTGVDLVITSQHGGSRPEHVPWQNKVFCYKGKSKKYPDFLKETGYGTAAGLKGVNCTHDFYPYWEGISIIPDDIKDVKRYADGKEYTTYAAGQKQRAMERDIRATKREIEAQKAIGGDTTALQAKLRKQSADYHKFSSDVGIRAKDNRLRVIGGSSNLSRTKTTNTVKANKSSKQKDLYSLQSRLLKSSKDGNIKEKDILIHKSLGAKARNYDVRLPSGEYTGFTEGTRITNVKTIAGKGKERKIDEVDILVEKYGGSAEEWQKKKGIGYLDYENESYKAEIHWYEEPTVGRCKFKAKAHNGEWIIDE